MVGFFVWFKGRTLFFSSFQEDCIDYYNFFIHLAPLFDQDRYSWFKYFKFNNYTWNTKFTAEMIPILKTPHINYYDFLHANKIEYSLIFLFFFDHLTDPMFYVFHREKDLEQFLIWLLKMYFFSRNNFFSIVSNSTVVEPDLLAVILPVTKELISYKLRYSLLYIFLRCRVVLYFIPRFVNTWVKENLGLWVKSIFSLIPFTLLLYLSFVGYREATIILFLWIGWRLIKNVCRFFWSFYQGYFLPWEERIHFILQLPFTIFSSLYLLAAFSMLVELYYPSYIWLSVILFYQIKIGFFFCKHWGRFVVQKTIFYFRSSKD
jgi:hypothetical protein